MAEISFNFSGQSYCNGGWLTGLTNPNVYDAVGSQNNGGPYLGPNPNVIKCYLLLKFVVPTVPGPTEGRSFTFTIPLANAGTTGVNITHTITSTGRTETNYFNAPSVPTSIVSTTASKNITNYLPNYAAYEFTTNASNFANGGTYYLWITSDKFVYAMGGSSFYSIKMTYTGTTPCGAPTSVTIGGAASGQKIYKPGPSTTFSLAWSGATGGVANAITGYTIQQKIGTGSWTHVANVASSPTTITLPSTRGSNINYRVQTQGAAGSAYYSGFKESAAYATVNSLPGVPAVTPSKTLLASGGGSITFSTSPGSDANTSQTRSVYMSSTSSTSGYALYTGGSVTVSSTKTYYFKTWDGLEYSSSYTSKTITVNSKPTVTAVSATRTALTGTITTGTVLAYNITGTSKTTSKTPTAHQWKIRYASTTGAVASGTVKDISTAASYSGTPISITGILAGYFYQIGYRYSDGIEWSDIRWATTIYQIPKTPKNGSFVSIYNKITGSPNVAGGNSTQYETGLHVTWKPLTLAAGEATIKEAYVVYQTSTNASTWSNESRVSSIISNPGTANRTFSYAFNIARGSYVRLRVVCKDETNRLSPTGQNYSSSYKRVMAPTRGSTISLTAPSPIRPLSGSNLKVSLGNIPNQEFSPKWTVRLQFPGVTNPVVVQTGIAQNTTTTQVLDNVLLNVAWSSKLSNINTIYTGVKVQAFLVNAYGVTSSVLESSGVTFNFQESPILSDSLKLINPAVHATDTVPTTADSVANNLKRLINSGENIKLQFNNATDLNNNITSYKIGISRSTTRPSSPTTRPTPGSFSDYKNYNSTNSAVSRGGTVTTITIPIEELQESRFCFFSVQAIDGTGLSSSIRYSNTYVVLSPARTPSISITIDSIDQTNGRVNASYTVNDFGGTKFPSTYLYDGSSTALNNYPNFERTGYEGKTFKITLQYSLNANFSGASSQTFTLVNDTTTKYYSKRTGTLNSSTTRTNLTKQKVFVRGSISITTGTKTITGYTNVAIFYPEEPTFSQRKNWIGINTNANGADEVFRVSDFSSAKKYVRLVGSAGNQTIEIDLSTGKIDGATISGGTW